MEGALDDLRQAGGILDFGRPFGGRAEEGAIVHLLEGAAAAHGALDLADEQHQRRRIVLGDMDAMGGVGRARPAGDEADSGAAGQPAVGQRHDRRPGLLAADRHRDLGVVERVERGEIGLARHAIDPLDPLRDQLIDEDPAAGAGNVSLHLESRLALSRKSATRLWRLDAPAARRRSARQLAVAPASRYHLISTYHVISIPP